MRGGELDRLVRVEQLLTTQDDLSGEPIKTWQLLVEVWAKKRDAGSREFFAAARDNVEQSTVWKMRWIEGVTPQMRIVHDGVPYTIIDGGIKEIGRREGLEILAVAKPL